MDPEHFTIQGETLQGPKDTFRSAAFAGLLRYLGVDKLAIDATVTSDPAPSRNRLFEGSSTVFDATPCPMDLELTYSEGETFEFQFTVELPSLALSTLARRGILPDTPVTRVTELLAHDYGKVSLVYDSSDDSLYVAQLDSDLKLAVFPGLGLEGVGFELLRSYRNSTIDLVLQCDIRIGSTRVGILIDIPLGDVSGGTWTLTLRSPLPLGNGIADILATLDGFAGTPGTFGNAFPDHLQGIGAFVLQRFLLVLDPAAKRLSSLSFQIGSVRPITLATGFDLQSAGLRMDILFFDRSPSFTSTLFGSVKVDDTLNLGISAVIPADPKRDPWQLRMEGTIHLPDARRISGLPMNVPVEELHLPQGFFQLSEIRLNLFELEFVPSPPSLTTLRADLRVFASFGVSHALVFEDPTLTLDLTDPFNHAQSRKVAATLGGRIRIGDIAFGVLAEKGDKTWAFTCGLYESVITLDRFRKALRDKFDVDLPASLLDVRLTDLTLRFTETSGDQGSGGPEDPQGPDPTPGSGGPAPAPNPPGSPAAPSGSGGTPAPSSSSSLTFGCQGALTIEGTEVDIRFDVVLDKNGTDYHRDVRGTIDVKGRQFSFVVDQKNTGTRLVATYDKQGGDTLRLHDLVADLSPSVAEWIPAGLEVQIRDVLFVVDRPATPPPPAPGQGGTPPNTPGAAPASPPKTSFLFGLDLAAGLDLSSLPLVGKAFPPDETLRVDDLQFVVVSAAIPPADVAEINGLLPESVARLPEVDGGLGQGFHVAALMRFGTHTERLAMPVGGTPPANSGSTSTSPAPATATATTAPTTVSSPGDNATWFTLQRTFGPVHFNRVGVRFQKAQGDQEARIAFLLDAALSLAGLTLSLDGLGFGSSLRRFDPSFDLKGLGLDYRKGPLEIGGAFLRQTVTDAQGTYDEYDGAAILKTEELTLSAIGSYARLDGHPSLFLYAVLDYPLGGPSFFFVTGLAAGFGYNRSLVIPPVDQVAQFPLVAEAVGGVAGTNDPGFLAQELTKLRQYLPPTVGESFLAVGIKFTSFKLVDSFALLSVSFGSRFEIDLLGLSTVLAPPGAGGDVPAIAEIQLALRASFVPDDGFLGVSAQLTSASYLLSRSCHLTGGFAFYAWFSPRRQDAPDHAGDFVLTVGGYHPRFQVPEHYPRVPRLGFQWQVDSELSLKGESYFALTPSALMAGALLEATWKRGSLAASFRASADFLVSWKPYHYEASMSVEIGVSYTFRLFGTHHLDVHVGASLRIWGPKFAGTAHIDLDVISFDIAFGGRPADPTPIPWSEFRDSFLPHPDSVCGISATGGLIAQPRVGSDAASDWVFDPKDFGLECHSAIPFTATLLGSTQTPAPLSVPGAVVPVGIAAMAIAPGGVHSTLKISITRDGAPAEEDFDFRPIRKDVPSALWGYFGPRLKPEPNADRFVKAALTGFEVRPRNSPTAGVTAPLELETLLQDVSPVNAAYRWSSPPATLVVETPDARRMVRESLASTEAVRARILQALDLAASDTPGLEAYADALLAPPRIEN